MRITYDPTKRTRVLAERGLDLADSGRIFDQHHLTRPDVAHSDVEERFITVGLLDDAVIVVVWTERDGDRRVITMWKADERQSLLFRLGRP